MYKKKKKKKEKRVTSEDENRIKAMRFHVFTSINQASPIELIR